MYAVLFIAMAISGLTIAAGFYVYLKKDKISIKRVRKLVKVSLLIYVILVGVFLFFLISPELNLQQILHREWGL